MVEYEIMIVDFRIVKEVRARKVNLFSNSQLADKQVNNETRILDDILARYKYHLTTLTMKFENVQIQHVPRNKNTQADTLSKLTASEKLNEKRSIIVMEVSHPSVDLPQILNITNRPIKEEWYTLM
jgi:ribonuclease HI